MTETIRYISDCCQLNCDLVSSRCAPHCFPPFSFSFSFSFPPRPVSDVTSLSAFVSVFVCLSVYCPETFLLFLIENRFRSSLCTGSLSSPTEESVDCDCASLVQSSIQDSAALCSWKIARPCLHRQLTPGTSTIYLSYVKNGHSPSLLIYL